MLQHPPESIAPLAETEATAPSTNEEKIVQLFDEVRAPLLRYLSGFPLTLPDSEDVIQEAFLSLFQQLQRGKDHQNVRGWLFRAAHNFALKKHQRSRSQIEKTGSLFAV